jgi:outer membrane lipoprotein carrier protein
MKRIVFFIMCFLSTQVMSQTPGEALQDKLNAMHSMTANFKQVVKAKSRIVSQSSGTMALARPGKFRWQTKDPMAQLVVADGKNMWIYDVDLEQVSVKKQDKGLGGTAALFLSGYDNKVTQDFDVVQTQNDSIQVYELKAKSSKENFQRIKLMFDHNNLNGLELYDQLGQVTTVRFSQIKANPKIDDKLFSFKPPKGVDVVHQ